MRAIRARRPRAHVEIVPKPSSPTRGRHHRHRRGVISIGAVSGVAVVIVVTSTAIIIVCAVADVGVMPRPPESPTRSEVPARQRGL
eukprot:748307-Pyramimonas_sp.AAC.1